MSSESGISRRDFIKAGAGGAAAAGGMAPMVQVGTPPGSEQTAKPVKVYMITDLEGVSGIYDHDTQCVPWQCPRWAESQQLLTGEVNAAVEGLVEGGATEVVVRDGHDSSRSLSALTISPHARLLSGLPVPPTCEVDSSYSALVFVGQHAMANAPDGILNHSFSSANVQNIWVNNLLVGEIGGVAMLAGSFGVPVIMLTGDTAACKELRALVPQAECAEVKSGVSRGAGFMLPHPRSCTLIRETARRAMKLVGEIPPYRVASPVEVKVEFTTRGATQFLPREGVVQLDERTWAFRGKDFRDAWFKWEGFG